MALRLSTNMFSQTLPRIFAPSKSLSFAIRLPLRQSFIAFSMLRPAAFALKIPGIMSDLWDSVLRAVPKKKTSHMKKRHRQMAGKALKDVKNLNTCPACGQMKRSHVLCQHCVSDIKKQWGKAQ
ncbi:hypothetical protein BJY04DRAFT_132725 [Aspergillus karnatakaensis]|uniref:bL32 family ribosomal protein n=1 Tax=Aspergillus karnatakaensis TaxID=1810916 RepID=UPI003CCCE7BD